MLRLREEIDVVRRLGAARFEREPHGGVAAIAHTPGLVVSGGVLRSRRIAWSELDPISHFRDFCARGEGGDVVIYSQGIIVALPAPLALSGRMTVIRTRLGSTSNENDK